MLALEQRASSPTIDNKKRFQQELLLSWVEKLSSIKINETRQPVINKEKFSELLIKANTEQKPIVFVAIGCQDWIKPDWGDPTVDRLMGRISVEGKRAKRFTQEMSGFSQSLATLGVPHRIHFSLSNVEGALHVHLQNMGLVIHNDSDAEQIMDHNVVQLAAKVTELGGEVKAFDHSQRLLSLTGATDLRELQAIIADKTNPNYREFLDKLYEFDLGVTAQTFVNPGELGPVWIDIQSFNFAEDVAALEAAAEKVAADMPILSIMPNAGNWRAAVQPQAVFAHKEQLVANLVGVNQVPADTDQWIKKLHKTRDEQIVEILSRTMDDEVVITDGQQKTLAVRLLFNLAFGFDPFEQSVGVV